MPRGTVNKATLVGVLGQDPEVRKTNSGKTVVNLYIATDDLGPVDDNGKRTFTTDWHRVTFFGNLADAVAKGVSKGSKIYVEGKNKTRKWTDQDGVERYTTGVEATSFEFLGSRQSSQPATSEQGSAGASANSHGAGSGMRNSQPQSQQGNPANIPQQPARPSAPAAAASTPTDGHVPANTYYDFDDELPFGG